VVVRWRVVGLGSGFVHVSPQIALTSVTHLASQSGSVE
jgi:hypothetical protein